MFLKTRNISSKIKRSKVTDYAALIDFPILSVNFSHVCIICVKIYEKISSVVQYTLSETATSLVLSWYGLD